MEYLTLENSLWLLHEDPAVEPNLLPFLILSIRTLHNSQALPMSREDFYEPPNKCEKALNFLLFPIILMFKVKILWSVHQISLFILKVWAERVLFCQVLCKRNEYHFRAWKSTLQLKLSMAQWCTTALPATQETESWSLEPMSSGPAE